MNNSNIRLYKHYHIIIIFVKKISSHTRLGAMASSKIEIVVGRRFSIIYCDTRSNRHGCLMQRIIDL